MEILVMIDERIPATGMQTHGREDIEMATRYAQLQVNATKDAAVSRQYVTTVSN